MKVKILTLLAAIFLIGNVSFGQGVGAYKAKRTEMVKVKKNNLAPQRQGFYVMPKVGVGTDVNVESIAFNLQAVSGYEFNNHFAIGVGAGFNNYILFYSGFFDISYERLLTVSIPLYINVHGDFSKHRTTAYYSLDLGFQMHIKKAIGDEWVCHKYYNDSGFYSWGYTNETTKTFFRGFFISPEIGVRFNSCYLGVNYTCAKLHSISDLGNAYNHVWFTHILSLKFGYKIPFRNVRL